MKISAPVIETVPVEKLKPWNRNPRKNHAVDEISKSMQAFGYMAPIICQKGTYRILAGHGRLMALKKLGVTEVPVIVADMDDDKASLYAVADNKLTEKAEWDFGTLADMLLEWEHKNFDTTLTGFDDKELEQIMNWVPGNDGEETKPIPEPPAEAVSKTGDLWELGVHRLLCGDSTKAEDVAKVMGGKKADMLLTDPPYGICVVPRGGGKIGGDVLAKNRRYTEIVGDHKEFDPSHLWSMADVCVVWGANFFPTRLPTPGQWIVWDKQRPDGTTFSEAELAWTSGNGMAVKVYRVTWHGMIQEGEHGERYHPAQKPVKLIVDVLSDHLGDSILDPYAGSGTTLIAAEKLGRRCYAIEIEPRYVDVCVKRWQNFTGKRAKNLTRPDVVL